MSNEKQISKEKSVANNWACAEAITKFKQRFVDPMTKRYEEAGKIFDNPAHQWESAEQKKKAQEKYKDMESQLDLFRSVNGSVNDLIHQHENLVDLLANCYASWYNMVSVRGKQTSSMMDEQAQELQRIFTEIYKALEPLKLPINPPNNE